MHKYTAWILLVMMLVGARVVQALDGELGILDLTANGGINPATSNAWKHGDSYRLVFLSSAKIGGYGNMDETWDHIARWNQEVQNFAANATNWSRADQLVVSGINGRTLQWNTIGSSADVDARDNTATNPEVDGSGHAILKMDGTTIVANSFNTLWSGTIQNIIDLTENKNQHISASDGSSWPFTGTATNGMAITTGSPWVMRNITINDKGQGISQGDAGNAMGWIDRSKYASTAANQLAQSIYGMSERLFVIDRTDTVAPGLVSFTNNVDDGPILFPEDSIVYTVTFNEPMLPNTITTSVFANAQSTDIRIAAVRQIEDPAVFEVTVLPLGVGSIQLLIKAGVTITDLNGNQLDTSTALLDGTAITVEPGPSLAYTVTFETDGTSGAALTGTTNQVVQYGSNATPVSASAPAGYNFINWTLNDSVYSDDPTVTVTNVKASVTLVANFLPDRTIRIMAASASKIYDGTALITNGFTRLGPLSEGHWVSAVAISGSQTQVGASANVAANAVIQDAATQDVTSVYTIIYDPGTLAVAPATPTVTWPTASEIVTWQTLGRSALMQGAASGVLGESLGDDFHFVVDTGTVVAAAADYAVAFIPSDPLNYMSITGAVHVTAHAPTETTAGDRATRLSWFDQFDLMPADAGVATFEQLLDVDSDGNDMSNWQEYIAGTDPTDPESMFRLLGVVLDPETGVTVVNWYGGTNGPVSPYIVQTLDSLSGGTLSWETLTNAAARVPGTNFWQGPLEGDIRFFRIQAIPDTLP